MKIKLSTTLLSTLLMLSIGSVEAVTLKLSHNQDKTHPVHKAMENFAAKAKEYSNGDVTIRIYPNGTLGTQRETMELIRSGAIQLVKTNAAEMESFENAYKIFSLPYLFRDRESYYKMMQGDAGQEILNSTKSKGYFGLTFYDGGSRSFYGNKAILKPEDLKGLKVRVQPSPGAVEMIKVMGGNPTPLDYGELYTALQQGVVDMAENSVMALTTMRHGEVAKNFSLDEHTMVPDVLLMSNASFDKLNEADKAAVQKAAKESMEYMKTLWSEEEQKEFAKLDKMGVKVYKVDKTPFIEIVQPMYVNFEKNNPQLTPLLKKIQSEQK
ncbi:TRAP transporter substrate-binding protein [Klebsiella huaxiensis]|uniref:TRAP transporter substrate-binding protein n=1 Tax=Klebsiella huaxiensis TaxID=2153354 RepID=UPI002F32DA9F